MTIYQVTATTFSLFRTIYQSNSLPTDEDNFLYVFSTSKEQDDGMERGDYFTKKGDLKPLTKGLSRFIEKGFDWLVLILVTLIVLSVLVFF
ncbi:hypothetical protein [Spirosoma gilvum]